MTNTASIRTTKHWYWNINKVVIDLNNGISIKTSLKKINVKKVKKINEKIKFIPKPLGFLKSVGAIA